MKLKTIVKFVSIIIFTTSIVSCSSSSSKTGSNSQSFSTKVSPVTGWKYNDKKGTGMAVTSSIKGSVPPGMIAIEGGSYTIGERSESVTTPRDNQRRRITVRSFYMDQYEVRNVDWREYTAWMDVVFGKVAPELVKRAQADGTVWREELAYNEPYIEHYFSHPSFDNYPIVGVTWEQAMDYCAWRTDRVNESALMQKGFIKAPDFASLKDNTDFDDIVNNFVFDTQKYLISNSYQPDAGKKKPKQTVFGEPRKVNMSDGILFPDFRLPTEAEWEFAAYGTKASKKDKSGFIEENQTYPWKGTQVRQSPKSKNKKDRGAFMANFVRGRGDMMGTAGALNDGASMPAPVNWYYPNNFGLYNMAGNVNEWVLDVYRATSFDDVAEYNSFRGNIYTSSLVESVDENGYNVYKVDSLGRIQRVTIENGDKRSYKDGDPVSSIITDFPLLTDTTYVSHIQNMGVQIDPTDVLAPKISDNTRVYKGGSWKDRVHWLNPSSRRYLEQDQATNDIGFRCAMSMIGDMDI